MAPGAVEARKHRTWFLYASRGHGTPLASYDPPQNFSVSLE
jgi:hypothetical protein